MASYLLFLRAGFFEWRLRALTCFLRSVRRTANISPAAVRHGLRPIRSIVVRRELRLRRLVRVLAVLARFWFIGVALAAEVVRRVLLCSPGVLFSELAAAAALLAARLGVIVRISSRAELDLGQRLLRVLQRPLLVELEQLSKAGVVVVVLERVPARDVEKKLTKSKMQLSSICVVLKGISGLLQAG